MRYPWGFCPVSTHCLPPGRASARVPGEKSSLRSARTGRSLQLRPGFAFPWSCSALWQFPVSLDLAGFALVVFLSRSGLLWLFRWTARGGGSGGREPQRLRPVYTRRCEHRGGWGSVTLELHPQGSQSRGGRCRPDSEEEQDRRRHGT